MTRPSETGAVRKPWGSAIPVALVYPNSYQVGMGNLGFQVLYKAINSHPRFLAERFFLPDSSSRSGASVQVPMSEESSRPLSDFAVIAFSVPFEMDYAAVPGILISAGIEPLQKDRSAQLPLILAGGVSVSMNPEPLAPFLDLAFIGELEEDIEGGLLFSALADILDASDRRSDSKDDLLEKLRNIPGVYVPSAYSFDFDEAGQIREIQVKPGFPHRVRAVKRLSPDSGVPVSVLFSPEAEFGDSLLVETNRGCGRGCRFCASGWIHRPVRHVALSRFHDDISLAVAHGKTVGLIGSDLAGHPQLEEVLARILELGGNFSLSSIRPEGLTPEVIRLMARSGQKTATLAPETASSRMKQIIGKEIPSARFHDLVGKLVSAGIPNIRFYFMVGLPTETDEDVEAISEFVLESRRVFVNASRPLGRIGKISVQLSPFVPKPWTPFQWAAMPPASLLEKRLRTIKEALRKEPNIVVRTESVQDAVAQAVLSRGDRRISGAILRQACARGRWLGAFKEEGLDVGRYAHREQSVAEILPWDVTDHGISKETLAQVFLKAIGHKVEAL